MSRALLGLVPLAAVAGFVVLFLRLLQGVTP